MKNKHQNLLVSFLLTCTFFSVKAQNNLGIGTASPAASAKLDVSATDKGILIPRMSKVQRDAIASPATSLMIYQTDNTPGFYYYNGTAWVPMQPASGNASFELYVTKTAAEAQTTAVGGNVLLPDLLTFSAVNSSNAALTGGNTWDGSTFTVGAAGAGLYLINCHVLSTPTSGYLMFDMNNSGNSSSSLYSAAGGGSSALLQSPHQFRTEATHMVWLAAGTTLKVRLASASAAIGVTPVTTGPTYLSIARIK